MGQAIKSDIGTATDAVSKFWGVDTGSFKGSHLPIGASNIGKEYDYTMIGVVTVSTFLAIYV